MLGPNQYHVRREDVRVAAADLLNTNVKGKITDAGVRSNVSAYVRSVEIQTFDTLTNRKPVPWPTLPPGSQETGAFLLTT